MLKIRSDDGNRTSVGSVLCLVLFPGVLIGVLEMFGCINEVFLIGCYV